MSKKINQQFLCSRMMLPEHCSGLNEHAFRKKWEENHRRPDMDDQLQEQLQQELEQALAKQQALKITFLDYSGYHTYIGVPLRIDPTAGLIFLHTGKGRPRAVKAAEVVKIAPLIAVILS